MDPLWSETCWSTFKYFRILFVSTYYILFISWIIKCLIFELYFVKAKWVRAAGEKTVFIKSEKFSSLVNRTADRKSVWIRKCLWLAISTRNTHPSSYYLHLQRSSSARNSCRTAWRLKVAPMAEERICHLHRSGILQSHRDTYISLLRNTPVSGLWAD